MIQLNIFINDELAFEYDRSEELEEKQREFLDRMDRDMDRGFRIHGEMISKPDQKQKATFISMNLLRALQQEDHPRITASVAYLSNRLPNVAEVHARDGDNHIDIEFVEAH